MTPLQDTYYFTMVPHFMGKKIVWLSSLLKVTQLTSTEGGIGPQAGRASVSHQSPVPLHVDPTASWGLLVFI